METITPSEFLDIIFQSNYIFPKTRREKLTKDNVKEVLK